MSKKTIMLIAVSSIIVGCATPINSGQKREMSFYQSKGYVIEEKNPGAAAAFGLLPGGGSFYVREYGLGVANLLLWPASILWDPVSGYDGATSINYYATKDFVSKKMKKDIKVLEDDLTLGKISREAFVAKKREIEENYVPE